MGVRVGINGFGRIGRNFFRAAVEQGADVELVAVNDLGDAATMAHLLKYDSVLGPFEHDVAVEDGAIRAAGREFRLLNERDPAKLPWRELGAEVVLESTGLFTKREQAQLHLDAGAEKVVISAPATDPDVTLVLGVNDEAYDRERHRIVSNASCTTNCIAPVARVLHDAYGIESGFMTTIHAYTNDQQILDLPHKDLRRARAAAINLIPTSTGAARAIGLVIPELKGKLDGIAVRAPVADGSIVDLVVHVSREVTAEEVNALFAGGRRSRSLPGHPALLRRAARLLRRDRQPLLLDLRQRADHGARAGPSRSSRGTTTSGATRTDSSTSSSGSCRGAALTRPPRSVRDADVDGKRVLVRVDLNVPLEDGRVADDTRIRAALPTLRLLLDRGAAEVVALLPSRAAEGRGSRAANRARRGASARAAPRPARARAREHPLRPGRDPRTTPPSHGRLAAGMDLYVNDAFGSAHRAHASTEAVAHLLPAYAGLLLERELAELARLVESPERPFVAVVGGAKVEDKIGVLRRLAELADALLVGGKMAAELAAQAPLGGGAEVLLPTDVVAAAAFEPDAESRVVAADAVPDGWLGLDIGPETRRALRRSGSPGARTVFWNGPMGVFEWPRFAGGHESGRRGGRGVGRVHRRRRRRLGAGDRGARAGGADRLGLDRRRRLARAARGQGAARRRGHPARLRPVA